MIYYLIGIRRSGIHAVANWLFPMMNEFIYLNNYELGKLTDIEMVVNGKFNILIGLESKDIDEVLKYTTNGKRVFITRKPTSIIDSQEAWYSKVLNAEKVSLKITETVGLICSYNKFLSETKETVIYYELWNQSKVYRKKISNELGLEFDDSNKEKVFGYGISSYDKTII